MISDHAVVACWSLEGRPQAAAGAEVLRSSRARHSAAAHVVCRHRHRQQWFSGSRAENSYFPTRSCSTCPRAATITEHPLISRIDPAPAPESPPSNAASIFDRLRVLGSRRCPPPPYPYLNLRDCSSREIGEPPSGPIAISPFHRI